MPLLGNGEYREPVSSDSHASKDRTRMPTPPPRRQSQHSHSVVARTAIMGHLMEGVKSVDDRDEEAMKDTKMSVTGVSNGHLFTTQSGTKQSVADQGAALSDTPATTAPSSPIM